MNYSYYKNIRVSLKPDDFMKVGDFRYLELVDMAQEDVELKKKARSSSSFKNQSEYKIYLANLVDYAGKKEIGIESDLVSQ